MKFTFSWLKEYLKTEEKLSVILENLTDLGLEVEKVIDPTEKLKNFTVGQIVNVEKHLNAEKLKICKVNTDLGEKQIVCGASNARKDLMVVVAHPGVFIPGIQKKISVGTIRGVKSFGMLCSEKEMEVSENHDGIIELPQTAKVGQKYSDFINNLEISIEIAITPNRPDALSIKGIARDLAARGIGEFVDKPVKKIDGDYECPIKVNISKETIQEDCTFFVGRYMKGLKNKESPYWLRKRLEAIGIKPISALVDVTNYITFDRGRPLHVFDAIKLDKNILIKKAEKNQKIIALDNKEYTFKGNETVIVSNNEVVSIAGIIGGLSTSVNFDTNEILLESAIFSPFSTARTGRQFQINSDARYRFERGIDKNFTESGLELATKMIMDICGGSPSHITTAGKNVKKEKIIYFNPLKVNSLIGINIDIDKQCSILNLLGFNPEIKEKKIIRINVPSWRPDVNGEADIVEEIVRVFSLSKLKGKPLDYDYSGVKLPIISKEQKRISILRRVLAANGFNECINYSFIDDKTGSFFLESKNKVEILNPISSEMNTLRPSLLPGLCLAALKNLSRGNNNIRFFEIGETFFGPNPNEQNISIAGIMLGKFKRRNVHENERDVDVFDIKNIVEICLRTCGLEITNLNLSKENLAKYFHPFCSANFTFSSDNILATFGELHPLVLKHFNLKRKIMIFEIFLENIPISRKKKISRPPLVKSEFQHVERDFSFVFQNDFEVGKIEKIIKSLKIKNIVDINIFDIFESSDNENILKKGKKSVAFSIKILPFERTFKDEEIEKVCSLIIKEISKKTGGLLRE